MRIRTTRPTFWRSKTIAQLDWTTRLVLKGLESYVDDNGVGKDSVPLICADVFPYDLSRDPSETLANVSRGLERLAAANLIARYDVDGEALIYIRRWKQLQKIDSPNAGRFPRPDGTMEYKDTVDETVCAGQSPSLVNGSLDSSEDLARTSLEPREVPATVVEEKGSRGVEESSSLTLVEGGAGGDPKLPVAAKAAPARTNTRGLRLPEDWRPSNNTIAAMKAEFPHLDLKAVHVEFCDYWRAVPGAKGRKTDWDATWRNRVREIASRHAPRNGHARAPSGQDEKVMDFLAYANRPSLPEIEQ
ncbi:hypothetical protein [Mycobacterium sp. 23]|uniref:hypothetical protein n=1 Tax=Mycobacterium sp. 23 TaxID=3400424 RepID=UPI003AB0EB2B